MAQKDSKKKPLSKKKLEKAASSELKKRTEKSEKKASKVTAKKAAPKKTAAAKKPVPAKKPARDVAPVKKVATTRIPRISATKPAEPSPTWTVAALRAHARAAGIIGYSRMKKDELLAELRAH